MAYLPSVRFVVFVLSSSIGYSNPSDKNENSKNKQPDSQVQSNPPADLELKQKSHDIIYHRQSNAINTGILMNFSIEKTKTNAPILAVRLENKTKFNIGGLSFELEVEMADGDIYATPMSIAIDAGKIFTSNLTIPTDKRAMQLKSSKIDYVKMFNTDGELMFHPIHVILDYKRSGTLKKLDIPKKFNAPGGKEQKENSPSHDSL